MVSWFMALVVCPFKLFDKMRSCVFSNTVLLWFKSHFKRTQMVSFNGITSSVRTVDSGIGQGTILGPLIFVFYINDVMNDILIYV